MNIDDAVWHCLVNAIDRFNHSGDPRSLLCPRCEQPKTKSERGAASERAIAYRLAFYLETELRSLGVVGDYGPLVVDCEYNRHMGKGKALESAEARVQQIVFEARERELRANDDGFYVFSIAPDIVVHQRHTDANNLLVIEVKKQTNPETEDYDALKLQLFTKPKEGDRGYGYKQGAWIVAEDGSSPNERKVRIVKRFEAGIGADYEG